MPRNRRQTRGMLHGVLVVDKPAGWTSHDVVARVRRLTRERRVGHAGTLDPAATGVLPVLVGDATRLVEFLGDADKGYVADITFGVSTDSGDIDGVVTASGMPLPQRQVIETALERFRGPISQVPPMHSAIQVGGKRLYELARLGVSIERAPRDVRIDRLELVRWESPVATLDVACGKGTYVRSLATDLGEAAGTVAYLSNLVRTWTGPFSLMDAWTMGDLEAALGETPEAEWPSVAIHPDAILDAWGAVQLSSEQASDWLHGRPIPVPGMQRASSGRVRAYDAGGNWLGAGRLDDNALHPWKVPGTAHD